jgi:hypothetical protein
MGIIPQLGASGTVTPGEYQRLKSEIILYGSEESVRALKAFTAMIEVGGRHFTADSTARIDAYSVLAAALRRDVFPETNLDATNLRSLTPFGDDA